MSNRWRTVVCAGLVVLGVGVPAKAQLEDRLEALDAALERIYDGNTVGMEECVEIAILGSSNLGSFEEDVETGNVDVLAAWGQWLPDLSANADWRKQERTDFASPLFEPVLVPSPIFDDQGNILQINGEDTFGFGSVPSGEEDVTSRFTNTSGGINTNWTVFSGFSRFAGLSRAKADRAASVATLDYQASLLVEQVSNAYLDYVQAILKVQVAEDAEDLAAKELQKSETYFDLGISTRSDVLQQKVQLQQNKLETVRARNEKRNAFASLVHLMNIPGGRPFEVDTDKAFVEEMTIPELAPLLDTARGSRRDLIASDLNVQARSSGVTEARSGFYPSVQIFASYSRSKTESPQNLRLGSDESDNLTWGIQGSWNIFDRFQTRTQSRSAVANRRKAEYNHRQAGLDLEKEIVQLRNNLIEAKESFSVATQTVEQSLEELRLAQERFKVGAGTSLDVINAQVGLAQARRDVVDAQTNYAKFWQQLDRATGGALR